MSFIDWSDPEGLFGLLLELLSDEIKDCHNDVRRERFLRDLQTELTDVADEFPALSLPEVLVQLQSIQDSVDPEFREDPTVVHLAACLEELQRILHATA